MNTPKTSIGTWAFCFGPFQRDPWPLSKVLEYAADVGYDGVELNGFRPHVHWDDFDTPSKCAELKKAIEGFGLGISRCAPDFT
ncbi:MAG: sugar phosphate isomerase/epimerase [Anaerolineales bacterium]|nr:MAG: sugar phosphate isomerase/epimerase [Anaerolineales bacterium]